MIYSCVLKLMKKKYSQLYVAPKRTSMDENLHRKQALKCLIKFVDKNYDSLYQVLFWPDLATCQEIFGIFS